MTEKPDVAPIAVVAGILIENRKILVTQRTEEQNFPLMWEFPGGKVEPGESLEEALAREFEEEIGTEVRSLGFYDRIIYSAREGRVLDVTFLLATRMSGAPRPLEVNAVRWVEADQLGSVDFIPANEKIVTRLKDYFRENKESK